MCIRMILIITTDSGVYVVGYNNVWNLLDSS